jgi:hypothetical protein
VRCGKWMIAREFMAMGRSRERVGHRGRWRVRSRALFAGAAAALLGVLAIGTAPAHAGPVYKGIWGSPNAFASDYCPLRAGIWQYAISWREVAPLVRPLNPGNPNDVAYEWPQIDGVFAAARACRIRVSLLLVYTPAWANGGRAGNVPPNSDADFAAFAQAAARRYPSVRHFQIWGEPSRTANWSLTKRTRRIRLTKSQRRAPRRYATLLNSAYRALNAVNRKNIVIGGMTLTRGDTLPLAWIRYMRLPNGRAPRFDMFGHNPFTARRPNLKGRLLERGAYDFSDLDSLAKAIDRYLVPKRKVRRRGRIVRRPRRHPKIYISEWTVPSNFTNETFLGFSVSRRKQARWLRAALRIGRRWKRLYTVGWYTLRDTSASDPGGAVGWGLRTSNGTKKRAWYTFKNS